MDLPLFRNGAVMQSIKKETGLLLSHLQKKKFLLELLDLSSANQDWPRKISANKIVKTDKPSLYPAFATKWSS